jgi:hypothetical protein
MEEIFFNHYSILKIMNHPDSKVYLCNAYKLLQQKGEEWLKLNVESWQSPKRERDPYTEKEETITAA